MEIAHPEFDPDPSLDRVDMETLQVDIARTARFVNDFDIDPEAICSDTGEPATIAGIDQAFRGDEAVSAVVVLEDGEVIERASASETTDLPYIPGLLAFREAPSIIAGLETLQHDPDILLFDGSGRIHYRQAGLATHVGVTFDIPAIGVIKNLLCGEPRESIEGRLPKGTRIPIDPDDEVDGPTDGPLGYVLQTRQFEGENRYVNPVYVSPGHRINPKTAVDIVERCCAGYKLPEPIRLADSYAAELTD